MAAYAQSNTTVGEQIVFIMAIRVNKLLREANIGMQTLSELLKALDYNETIEVTSKIPDDIAANVILGLCYEDVDFLKLVEKNANKNVLNQQSPNFPIKILGKIDLDGVNNSNRINKEKARTIKNLLNIINDHSVLNTPQYDENNSMFWVEELLLLSSKGDAYRLSVGSFDKCKKEPLYSVIIGNNGVGKSIILKEIVDFFVDLYAYINETKPRFSSVYNVRLRGVKYHIDGVCCEVIRLGRTFIAKIDGKISTPNNLRLPSIVACCFSAFDKFPVQKVNGSFQTRYDLPYYKYVGAHVNGNMISSSAIVFRMLFALNEQMDERQRRNISSLLDFIGYDHKVSLIYSLVLRSKKNGNVRDLLIQRVQKDREYANLSNEEKNSIVKELYEFYKSRLLSLKTHFCFEIDFDQNTIVANNELKSIYKLKQYDLVNYTGVFFYKHGLQIDSEGMSSGEFAMLAMILSISAAANDNHTLILIDEPELSLHPNWQMTFIDNLDRALKNQNCHLMITTHSHMLVSDLPMNRSTVSQWEKGSDGIIVANQISENTYGWSAEEVLLKVFKTATDRNRYFGERIAKLLEQMGNNTISPKEVADELKDLKEISLHLSDVDPMKMVLNTIIEAYR